MGKKQDEMQEKKAMLEAALFMTEKPLLAEELCEITKLKKGELESVVGELEEKYSKSDSGIEISRTGGFKLSVKPQYVKEVARLTRHSEMSRGLLRVLSIIAHNEPVTQSDLVKVIGNRVYEYIKELEELGFIKTEKSSRTKKIYTTRLFEQYFGIRKEDLSKNNGNSEENK